MSHVLKYSQDFTGALGGLYRWQILQDGWAGGSTAITASGRSFINTTWQMSDGDEYSPLFISETTLSILDTDAGAVFSDLVALLEDNQDGALWLYIKDMPGDTLLWRGIIKRGEVSAREDIGKTLTVTAHDGLQTLETAKFASTSVTPFANIEEVYTGRVTYTQLVQKALQEVGLGSGFYITSSLYPALTGQPLVDNANVQLAATQNPFDNVYVDRREFRQEEKDSGVTIDHPEPCANVIRDTLTRWGCIMFQWLGDWHIVQVNKRGDASYKQWAYDYNGAYVATADITDHVVTFANELNSRTGATKSQLAGHDSVRVDFDHGEYTLMKNPSFEYTTIGAGVFRPHDWTVVGSPGSRYENIGKGDGRFASSTFVTTNEALVPTTTSGTSAGSVDDFVNNYCDVSTGTSDATTLRTLGSLDPNGGQIGVINVGLTLISSINIDIGTMTRYAYAGDTIWIYHPSDTTYSPIVLTSDVGPGSTVVYFTPVILNSTYYTSLTLVGKWSGYASSTSYLQVGVGERIRFVANFIASKEGAQTGAGWRFGGTLGSMVQNAFAQVVLTDGATPYYLKADGPFGLLSWTTTVSWLSYEVFGGDWQNINAYVYDTTPIAGTITTTVGPSTYVKWRFWSGAPLGEASYDEIMWDNVNVLPLLAANNPNTASRSIIVADDDQATDVLNTKQVGVRVSDASIAPWEVGTTLDVEGFIQTEGWQEIPITDLSLGTEHIRALARMVLRSTRSPRQLHDATYKTAGQVLGPYHVLSRGGSSYAPFNITVDWEGESTSGSWYKVTEEGFISQESIIHKKSTFVQSKGGVSSGTAAFVQGIGSALFDEGSKALTRTTAVIPSGNVSSISVEAIAEPVLKVGDLIAIFGPALEYKQVQVKTDQLAGATTIAIADKDTIGTDANFETEIGYPAAVMFTEQELLTIARLGEQGFKINVLGKPLGKVDGAQSGTITQLTVKEWIASADIGDVVNLADGTALTLTADIRPGETVIYFSSAVVSASDNEKFVNSTEASFSVTATQVATNVTNISTNAGNISGNAASIVVNANQIALNVTDISTHSGEISANTSSISLESGRIDLGLERSEDRIGVITSVSTGDTLTLSGGINNDLFDGDFILIINKTTGAVSKREVKTDAAQFDTSVVLTTTITVAINDVIYATTSVGLRIDMDGIGVKNTHLYNTGTDPWDGTVNAAGAITVPGSQGWIITRDGKAEFSDVTVRGAVVITEASGFSGSGKLIVGTGTKDSTLDGWAMDSSEFVGQLAGVDQVILNTSGSIVAGGDKVTLDSTGITVNSATSGSAMRFQIGGTTQMSILAETTGLFDYTILDANDYLILKAHDPESVYGTAQVVISTGEVLETTTPHVTIQGAHLEVQRALRGGERVIDAITSAVTVANSLTETTVITETVTADVIKSGDIIRVWATGIYGHTATASTMTLKVKLGGTIVATEQIYFPTASSSSGFGWDCEFFITMRSPTSAYGSGRVVFEKKNSAGDQIQMIGTGPTAVSSVTTNDLAAALTMTWSLANASNTITAESASISILQKNATS